MPKHHSALELFVIVGFSERAVHISAPYYDIDKYVAWSARVCIINTRSINTPSTPRRKKIRCGRNVFVRIENLSKRKVHRVGEKETANEEKKNCQTHKS